METQLQMQSLRDEEEEDQTQQLSPLASSSSPSPSSTSSPSHEFSFTVSLDQSSSTKTLEKCMSLDQTRTLDLSPADEIFWHGHLLPLHRYISHKHVSPRSSSTRSSQDCFTIPIDNNNTTNSATSDDHPLQEKNLSEEQREKSKSKPFSLFSLSRLRRRESSETMKRGSRDQEKEGEHHRRRPRKRNFKFDVIKRYMRLLKPFLVSLRNRGGVNHHQRHRVQRSAPVSMIHSPTYSGILVASGSITPTNHYNSTSHHRTIEDLQEAIQAAITHCKKSNASKGRTLQSALSM